MEALVRRQDAEDAEAWKEQRRVQEANKQMVALKDVERQAAVAAEQVRKRKAQIAELENLAESRENREAVYAGPRRRRKAKRRRRSWAKAAVRSLRPTRSDKRRPLCRAEERLAVVQGIMGCEDALRA